MEHIVRDEDKPQGEILFEEYLEIRGLKWDYEPEIGTKRPDYLVHAPQPFVCEVEDLVGSDFEIETIEKSIQGQHSGGACDPPIDYVNRAIRRAAKQMKPAKGKFPCLALIHNEAIMPNIRESMITQAMFGIQKMFQNVGPDGATGELECNFTPEKRYLTRTQNTTVSAVGVIEYVQPNISELKRLEDGVIAKVKGDQTAPDQFRQTAMKGWVELKSLYEQLEKEGKLAELQRKVPRLLVYHNPWALLPFPTDFLDERLDQTLYFKASASV